MLAVAAAERVAVGVERSGFGRLGRQATGSKVRSFVRFGLPAGFSRICLAGLSTVSLGITESRLTVVTELAVMPAQPLSVSSGSFAMPKIAGAQHGKISKYFSARASGKRNVAGRAHCLHP